MDTSGEVADLMVKEGIQITESSVKLMALGAKNLTAIIMALLQEDNKLQGKTKMKQLLKADKPLSILQIKEEDLKEFNSEAKKYGVLFTAVTDKTNNTGLCDIIAKQDDVTKLNYIMEKLGYAVPNIEEDKDGAEKSDEHMSNNKSSDKSKETQSKNSRPRPKEPQSDSKYTRRGDTVQTGRGSKPSVRKQIEDIKVQQSKAKNTQGRVPLQRQPIRPAVRKKKAKGKAR